MNLSVNAFDVDARVSTGAGRDSFIEFIKIEEEFLDPTDYHMFRATF